MKRFPFALRFSVPAILLLLGSSLSLFSFQREVSLSYQHAEEDAIRQARSLGDENSAMLEYLFLYRQADRSAADLLISKTGGNPNLRLVLMCDENNLVILSNRYELQHRPVSSTEVAYRLSSFERVRQTLTGQVILALDKRSVQAIYPVALGTTSGQLRPTKVGVLLLEYDLSVLKQRFYNDALQRSLEASAVLALLCTTVWFFFYKTLTLRVGQLVETTNRLAKGEFSVRAGLQGSDELTQIATAFDHMANQIQMNQQQLQKLAQHREELLNLLASQIHNSLDLDTILSTAVRETRDLLGVDRCNFMWCCFADPAPNFHLSHEAKSPNLPSALGQYPIEDFNKSDLEALFSSQSVQIDDLTQEDMSLNASLRERWLAQGDASFACCPIPIRSGKLGLISCAYCSNLHSWSNDEIELLQSVANQLTIAIEQAELYEQTRIAASHDLLTGLPNRMLFNERLSFALVNVLPPRDDRRGVDFVNLRHSQGMLAVMFLDLDRFKTINDTLGHTVGDRLLQGIARRVKACLREDDIIARWGGDEFTLLMPHIGCAEDALNIAQRILEALKPTFDLEGHQIRSTFSIGIALYPDDGQDAETLMKNADAALYHAKEQGRNNYQRYSSAMNSKASEMLALENSLHQALERGEFVIYYQPQVNTRTGEITRMEALLRWQHPELGLISPGIFIPLAEENGLIVPIGEWVLRTACTQNKAWQVMGLPPLRVAVNISSRQFRQPNLLSKVAQVLQETELEPHYLELEITESTVMQDANFTRTILRELQQIGIYVAMDDFGTGYSSLSYLKKFSFHTIKIDQYFIRDLSFDPHDRAIVTAIIALGRGLGLTVVAEGVETQEQLYCLQSLQCEEMQGYLFSRPLSVEKATELLQTNFSLFSTSKDCSAEPYSRGDLKSPPALFGKEWEQE